MTTFLSLHPSSSMDGCAKKPRLEEDRSGSDFNGVASRAKQAVSPASQLRTLSSFCAIALLHEGKSWEVCLESGVFSPYAPWVSMSMVSPSPPPVPPVLNYLAFIDFFRDIKASCVCSM